MNEKDYVELLDKAYSELPEVLYKKDRFEVPQVKGRLVKTRTQIDNFVDISKTLGRKPEHLLKYVLREAGVRGDLNTRGALTLHSRFQPAGLNKIIERYYGEYVECKHCRSPDTEISDLSVVRCKACGHQEKVKGL